MSQWKLSNQRNGEQMARIKTVLILIALSFNCSAGIIADTIYMESRGENQWGRRAVATVIWNRSKNTCESFREVCLKPKQFSCWNSGYEKPRIQNSIDRRVMKEAMQIEFQMLMGWFYPLDTWTQYHAIYVNPYWSKHMINVTIIGRHKFGEC